jgi:hypothetical protein
MQVRKKGKVFRTVRRKHFEDSVVDGQHGDIEGTAAKIEDENVAFTCKQRI